MVYVVAYDLKEPNTPADYAKIIEAIKAYGTWARLEQSVWLIESNKTATELRDELKNSIRDASDVLFVAKLSGEWASWRIGKSRVDWLKQRNFSQPAVSEGTK